MIGAGRSNLGASLEFLRLPGPTILAVLSSCALCIVFATMLFPTNSRAAQPGLLKTEFIFESAPVPECHASTIAETKEGLVAAWFGGKYERSPDVGIWLARQQNGQWATPVEIANGIQPGGKRYPCWNPVLFQTKEGPLLLFFKIGPDPESWWGMLMTSTNSGASWSKPARLPPDVIGPVKNKPVQLTNGDLLCGSSTEVGHWLVHFERTTDLGKTWEMVATLGPTNGIEAIQPSILIHPGDRLQALGRTQQGRIFESWSEDNGHNWSPITLTQLPNPNSGIDAVTLCDGRQLLVYNHTPKGRSPLNVAVSNDGKSWQAGLILENEPGKEFSYPAVIQTADGLVHVVYTWQRKRIKHAVINPAAMELKPI
jgi:predicted neuraminidase